MILNGTWLACFEYETSGDAGRNLAYACIREWIGLWCGLGGVGSEEYAWRSTLGGVGFNLQLLLLTMAIAATTAD